MAENRFITSDLHFGHKNILEFDGRPYSSIEEHDEALIQNWNSLVRKQDRVYCLGDMFWYHQKDKIIETLGRLNGKIRLVRGNHDELVDKPGIRERFEKIENLSFLKLKGEGVANPGGKLYVTLCHYAMHRWLNSHRPDSWHLYGHSHGQLADRGNLSFDVGIMQSHYHPIPWEVLVKVMKNRIDRGMGPGWHHRR